MLQYLRGFFSFLIGLATIGFVISKVSSCVTYGKMDGTDHLGDCHLPKVEAEGGLLAVTEKGVTKTSCVLYVRNGSWHRISHPIMREWNCAINGYGHIGTVSNRDVVVEESFWKTTKTKEDVCAVVLSNNEWVPGRSVQPVR